MKIRVDVSRQKEDISNIADKLLYDIHVALAGVAYAIENDAKRACPVDTGRLRASIASVPDGIGKWLVGTNVEYAPYVELGTGIFGPRKTRVQKMPPPRILERWAWRKFRQGGLGFAIAMAIYKRGGNPPQPFLRPAFNAHKDDVVRAVRGALRKWL